jgi:predicted O-methyltransferase YrrM
MTREELLQELEQLKDEGKYPNIDRETAQYMYDLIVDAQLTSIFEFGAANGYSTIWLAMAAQAIGGQVITTEWGKERFAVLLENLQASGLDSYVTAHNRDALEVIAEVDKIDFSFIDAMARQYIDYFKALEPHLSDHAIVVADNVVSHREKLQDFLEYVKMSPQYTSEELALGKGILVIRKK